MEEKEFIIRGVAHDTNVAKFAVLGIPNTPGIAHAILQLAENNVDVDMIVQSIRNMEKMLLIWYLLLLLMTSVKQNKL